MTAPTVGLAGLGRMGVPMAERLLGAGFPLIVHNRTTATAERFASQHGTRVAATPADLAEADLVLTMVADGPALLDLLDGADGLAAALRPGAVVVDMGTTGSVATAQARRLLAGRGAHLVEAPVSGSVAAVVGKTLLVMLAGDDEPVARALPVVEALAGRTIRVGGPGAGAAMKLAVNAVLFGINEAIAESLVLAERAGIDRQVAYEVFASSAVAAPVVHYRRAVFERPGEVPVTFAVDLAVKDLRLILALADEVGAPMPQAHANIEVMGAVSAAGMGSADMGEVAVHLRSR